MRAAALLVLTTRAAPAWSRSIRRPGHHRGGDVAQIRVAQQVLLARRSDAATGEERLEIAQIRGDLVDAQPFPLNERAVPLDLYAVLIPGGTQPVNELWPSGEHGAVLRLGPEDREGSLRVHVLAVGSGRRPLG